MLKKNLSFYSGLISHLPLSELAALYERSADYPKIRIAIENEIDFRLTCSLSQSELLHGLQSCTMREMIVASV
jgi:hypothetical protein